MLIKALYDYYDILSSDGKIVDEAYSEVKVHFLVSLTSEGKIAGILEHRIAEERPVGKNKTKIVMIPHSENMPKRTDKPGIDSNIVEHRPHYIFGLDYNKAAKEFSPRIDGVTEAKAVKPIRSHEAFIKDSRDFFGDIDSPIVNAFMKFVEGWNPNEECRNPYLLGIGKEYATAGYAFCLAGNPGIMLHNDPQVRKKWEQSYYSKKQESEDGCVLSQCAVTGERTDIARLHSKITGLPGGMSVGIPLVCFNNDSEESYGITQSYNSNISETAMQRYVASLNYLVNNRDHRIFVDDMTVVFWAMSKEPAYIDWFNHTCNSKMTAEEMDRYLKSAFETVHRGQIGVISAECPENLDPNVEFYIAGLKPNTSRVAVKFCERRRFGDLMKNILQHQLDMRPYEKARSITLAEIKEQLISPKSTKENIDPSLSVKLLQSILNGTPYPDFLLSQVVKRVKTDQDEENKKYIKINATRIGIIKACINRKLRYEGKEEEIKMSLDVKNNNPAYLCGRLFAVLEKAQEEASNSKLNHTIKDSYFASASSTPAVIFTKLLKLAQYHLQKVEATKASELNRFISIIINMLGNEFPTNLSLTEQGKFIIGYYHQNNVLNYHNKKENTEEE